MELRKRNLGLALGLTLGLAVLVATWWLVLAGKPGETLSRLSAFYIGYSVSFVGGIIGFIWGFIDGFICGVLIAWFYNLGNKLFKSKTV